MPIIVWVTTDHAYYMFFFSELLPYTLQDRKLGAWTSFHEQGKCFSLPSEHLEPDSLFGNFVFVLPCYEFLPEALKGTDLQSQWINIFLLIGKLTHKQTYFVSVCAGPASYSLHKHAGIFLSW